MLILLGTYCKFVEYTLIFCIKMMLSFSEQSQFTVSQTGGPYSNLEQKYFRLISQKFYKKCFTKQMFRIKWKMSVLCLPFRTRFCRRLPIRQCWPRGWSPGRRWPQSRHHRRNLQTCPSPQFRNLIKNDSSGRKTLTRRNLIGSLTT